jgi:signal transduction histidine kinase/CheY-like chemotaxis protein
MSLPASELESLGMSEHDRPPSGAQDDAWLYPTRRVSTRTVWLAAAFGLAHLLLSAAWVVLALNAGSWLGPSGADWATLMGLALAGACLIGAALHWAVLRCLGGPVLALEQFRHGLWAARRALRPKSRRAKRVPASDRELVEGMRRSQLRTQRMLLMQHQTLQRELKRHEQFLQSVSKSIARPLGAAQALTEMVARNGLSVDQQRYMDALRLELQDVRLVLDHSIMLDRLPALGAELSAQPTDASRVVQRVVRPHMLDAFRSGTRVYVSFDSRFPARVLLDACRFTQIVDELVANAVRATRQGHIRVSLLRSGPRELRFVVTDSGTGMSAAQLERHRRRMSQARAQGRGGLVRAHLLARELGGELRLASQSGVGTQVIVQLPCTVHEQKPGRFSARHVAPPARLLIYADDPACLPDLEPLAVRAGWQVHVARQPEDLFAVDQRSPLHVLVVQMAPNQIDLRPVITKLAAGTTWSVLLHPGQTLAPGQAQALRSVDPHLGSSDTMRETLTHLAPMSLRDWEEMLLAFSPMSMLGQRPPPPPAAQRLQAARTSGRLLLVEDNQVARLLAEAALRERGWAVVSVESAEQALRVLDLHVNSEAWQLDLVLCDIDLPGASGADLVRRWRRVEAAVGLRAVPFICVSATDRFDVKADALAAGMLTHLGKRLGVEALDYLERFRPAPAPVEPLTP